MTKITAKSSDEALLAACKQQNRLAQRYLYERYFGKLLGISMRYTQSREEGTDVLNRAFLKIFDSIATFKATGSLQAWMAKIVFHTAIDFARAQSNYKKRMVFNLKKDKAVGNPALQNLAAEDIYKVIQQLPRETRTVFSLYVLDGYKHREIAEQLKISEGTSKWHLSNARRLLQGLLKDNKNAYFSSSSNA